MRLIDGDELRETMYHEAFETDTDMQKWDGGCWIRYKMFENALKNAPTIEAEPIRYGEWIGKPMIGGYSRMRCSVCDNVFLDNKEKWNYCPCCGARMVNENEDAD